MLTPELCQASSEETTGYYVIEDSLPIIGP